MAARTLTLRRALQALASARTKALARVWRLWIAFCVCEAYEGEVAVKVAQQRRDAAQRVLAFERSHMTHRAFARWRVNTLRSAAQVCGQY